MSHFKSTLIFFVSFIITIFFVSFLSIAISPMLENVSPKMIDDIIFPIILTIGLIFFMFLRALIKWFRNKKIISQNKIVAITENTKFSIIEKLWILIFVLFIYFAPIFRRVSNDIFVPSKIILFVISLIIVIILTKFSEKSMKIYFLETGVVIAGIDFRLELLLNNPVNNSSGYYPYKKIDSFVESNGNLELILPYGQGKIVTKLNENDRKNIVKILQKNGLKPEQKKR